MTKENYPSIQDGSFGGELLRGTSLEQSDEREAAPNFEPEFSPEIERERPKRNRYVPKSFIASAIVVSILFVVAVGVAIYAYNNQPIVVPNLIGKTQGAAERYLANNEIELGEVSRQISTHPAGTVIAQDPAPESRVSQNTPINLHVSVGDKVTIVPDIVGESEQLATGKLYDQSIAYETNYVVSTEPTGTVIKVEPKAGTEIAYDEVVTLSVAIDAENPSMLMPRNMQGIRIVLDPDRSLSNSSRDIPLELANRIQGLLEASGAKVTMTRSALTKENKFTKDSRKNKAQAAQVDMVVTITVSTSKEESGLQVVYSDAASNKNVKDSKKLSELLAKELGKYTYPAANKQTKNDPLGLGNATPWVSYVLGSTQFREDTNRFTSDSFIDDAARAFYNSLSEALKLPLAK